MIIIKNVSQKDIVMLQNHISNFWEKFDFKQDDILLFYEKDICYRGTNKCFIEFLYGFFEQEKIEKQPKQESEEHQKQESKEQPKQEDVFYSKKRYLL